MVQGSVKSCGCEHIKRIAKASTTHGMTNTRTYSIWQAMRLRCNRINQDYSCRGITYDERWDSFENFYLDMGEVPEGMSIDRIDVNGNYNKDNCRWATQEQQANNKRSSVFIEYNGKKQTVSQWAKELKMNHHTLRSRLKKGLTAEQALTPLPAEEQA